MSEVKTDSVVNVSGDNDSGIDLSTNDVVAIKTANSERLRVDASGNTAVGTTTTGFNSAGLPLVVGSGSGDTGMTIYSGTGNNGSIHFADGTSGDDSYRGIVTYDHSNNLMDFFTNASRAMRIDSDGDVGIGTTSPGFKLHIQGANNVAKFDATSLVDRVFTTNQNTDGDIIVFDVGNSAQGKISVSSGTVTYGGGHLGRWSQATDGNRIDGLVKGTVMTNLDQMAVWSHDEVLWAEDDELPDGVSVGDVRTAAYTEDNEQLNCMAVSSVEGDANVAGVFVNWDYDDDGFNDMVVAMTGDMVIRIAQGTTVERGDLLMSAGDGTAKPQGDDIVRSKTIAKVTSTNVSRTYDDGSYLVPCVLMAC